MSNSYTWSFPAFEAYPSHEGHSDVVFTIHWRLKADDGADHVAEVYSTQAVEYKAGSPFTPYADLTPEQVEGWVVAAMGEEKVAELKANLDAQIEALVAPTSVTLPAPWA